MNYSQLFCFQLHVVPRPAHSLVPGPAASLPVKRGSMVSRARAHTLAKLSRASATDAAELGMQLATMSTDPWAVEARATLEARFATVEQQMKRCVSVSSR